MQGFQGQADESCNTKPWRRQQSDKPQTWDARDDQPAPSPLSLCGMQCCTERRPTTTQPVVIVSIPTRPYERACSQRAGVSPFYVSRNFGCSCLESKTYIFHGLTAKALQPTPTIICACHLAQASTSSPSCHTSNIGSHRVDGAWHSTYISTCTTCTSLSQLMSSALDQHCRRRRAGTGRTCVEPGIYHGAIALTVSGWLV